MNDLVANPFGSAVEKSEGRSVAVAAAMTRTMASMQIALQYPRDERRAVDKMLNEFSRPTLAAAAVYSYPRGGQQVEGPSIHAAVAMARNWGHLDFGYDIESQDEDKTCCTAFCHDKQGNMSCSISYEVRHWRDTKKGGYKLVDSRDIGELVANISSRKMRQCILKMIPADVVDSCIGQANLTMQSREEVTPEKIKKMVTGFETIGVTADQIKSRLGRNLDSMSPAQVIGLRKIFQSIKEGISAPSDWFEESTKPAATVTPRPPQTASKPANKAAEHSSSEKPWPELYRQNVLITFTNGNTLAGKYNGFSQSPFGEVGIEVAIPGQLPEMIYVSAIDSICLAEEPK